MFVLQNNNYYYNNHELNWYNVHYNSKYSNYHELNWNNILYDFCRNNVRVHYNSEHSNDHERFNWGMYLSSIGTSSFLLTINLILASLLSILLYILDNLNNNIHDRRSV